VVDVSIDDGDVGYPFNAMVCPLPPFISSNIFSSYFLVSFFILINGCVRRI